MDIKEEAIKPVSDAEVKRQEFIDKIRSVSFGRVPGGTR